MTDVAFTSKGVEVVATAASTPPEPVDRLIVATTWHGPVTVGRLHVGEPEPSPPELDAMAGTVFPSGVRPVVRVLERPRTTPA